MPGDGKGRISSMADTVGLGFGGNVDGAAVAARSDAAGIARTGELARSDVLEHAVQSAAKANVVEATNDRERPI